MEFSCSARRSSTRDLATAPVRMNPKARLRATACRVRARAMRNSLLSGAAALGLAERMRPPRPTGCRATRRRRHSLRRASVVNRCQSTKARAVAASAAPVAAAAAGTAVAWLGGDARAAAATLGPLLDCAIAAGRMARMGAAVPCFREHAWCWNIQPHPRSWHVIGLATASDISLTVIGKIRPQREERVQNTAATNS